MTDPDEEEDMPRFKCTLPIPDEIQGGSRMLLEQVDILRQEISFVYRRGNAGKRALLLSRQNQAAIEKFNRLFYIGTGIGIAGNIFLGIYVKFFAK
jgi:hypothetical protein